MILKTDKTKLLSKLFSFFCLIFVWSAHFTLVSFQTSCYYLKIDNLFENAQKKNNTKSISKVTFPMMARQLLLQKKKEKNKKN